MVKTENYMKAKHPEPEELIACWRSKRWNLPEHKGTAWYRIADSHISPTPQSDHPHYWVCSCNEHKPYTKNQTQKVKKPAMTDYSEELEWL